MAKHSFKKGDKVKIAGLSEDIDNHLYSENIVGAVIKKTTNRSICVKWNTKKCVICGLTDCPALVTVYYHSPYEIKHAMMKGEQLMFNFMS